MRDVRSAQYFEQMKGRGARTIPSPDFQAVTPDAQHKTRFVIVDAIGVTEHSFVEPPLNRLSEKSVPLKKLLEKAAALTITEDETATLASRLSALERQLAKDERGELDQLAGQPMQRIVRGLVEAVDPDQQARAMADQPEAEPAAVLRQLIDRAVEPLAFNPPLRQRILELRGAHDRVIDEVSRDKLLLAEGVVDTNRAKSIVESWMAYLLEHRDQISAIQVIQEATSAKGRSPGVTFAQIKELADSIKRPPRGWTPDLIWSAYEVVDQTTVHHSDSRTLTDLVSLIRYTLGLDSELVPYADQVQERFQAWLQQQDNAGVKFNYDQRWWLDTMVEVVCASAGISDADLDQSPFAERGGVDGLIRDFGNQAEHYLTELNGLSA